METNEELLARHVRVRGELDKAIKVRNRCKPGANRDRKSRWVGCLNFTLLSIRQEIQDRGLPVPH